MCYVWYYAMLTGVACVCRKHSTGALCLSCICLQVQTSILGLALTYTLQLTTAFLWFTLTSVEVENHMTSVERLQDYARLPSEPPGVDEGGKAPPKGWPR